MKKFYFLLISIMLGLVASAQDYYLIGGFNNWTLKKEHCKFTDAGDGSIILDYQGTLTSGFKLNDGTWSNDNANFGSNGSTLEIGVEYTLTVGGSSGNITMASNIDNPHIVFNPANKTLLITGQSVEAKMKYGIHGQIFGNADWETIDMEDNGDGYWILTAEIVPGEFGVKVMDEASGSQTGWYSSADENNTITENSFGTWLTAAPDGKYWSNTITGTATITFNANDLTLKFDYAAPGNVEQITINGNAVETARYTIDGRKIEAPAQGINIIHYSNGTVAKQIVR